MTYQEYAKNVLLCTPWAEFGLPVHGRVLDVGSGSGWTVSVLNNLGLDAVGVDVAPTGMKSVAGDATALPFQGGRFDGVVCLRVLHHIPDSRSALHEFARVLRPGGFLLLAVGNVRSYTLLAFRRGGKWSPNIIENRYELYDRHRLAAFLASSGFDVMAMRTCHFLPRALSRVNVPGFHRLLAVSDPALGRNAITGQIGPLILTYARRT